MVRGALAELSDDEDRDELTPAESRQFVEEEIRRYLGISLAEFIQRAEEGTLPDKPVVAHLVLLTGVSAAGFC